jgi:hypothetical protein
MNNHECSLSIFNQFFFDVFLPQHENPPISWVRHSIFFQSELMTLPGESIDSTATGSTPNVGVGCRYLNACAMNGEVWGGGD